MSSFYILASSELSHSELPYGSILMGVLGGLALFLFGMELMSSALKAIAGDGLRQILAKLTTNRFTGAVAGAVVTAIIQSSSITTVLVVGFISAGLLNLSQSVGIIMGANIGTTMTAQIIAFKVTEYALLLIAVGFALSFFLKNNRIKDYGNMVMGLGLIFLGMQLMSDSTQPLQTFEPFIQLMTHLDSPLKAIAFAALFTALIQSSSATTGIVIILASHGFLNLDAGIALIFGANIGTCVTAWLAAIGKSIEAKRAATIHILFNIAGVALWFFFIPQLAEIVAIISPHSTLENTAERLAAETPRQIANAHTIFNISNTLIFIWFTAPLARLTTFLIPDPSTCENSDSQQTLDPALIQTPALALEAIRSELLRMSDSILDSTCHCIDTVTTGNANAIHKLSSTNSTLQTQHTQFIDYIRTLAKEPLDEKQSNNLNRYLSTANYLQNIGDTVETQLVSSGLKRIQHNLTISPSTQALLTPLQLEVCQLTRKAIHSLVDHDSDLACEVIDAKKHINTLAAQAEQHLMQRLISEDPHRATAFRLESEIIEHLKRIYYFAKRIAKQV